MSLMSADAGIEWRIILKTEGVGMQLYRAASESAFDVATWLRFGDSGVRKSFSQGIKSLLGCYSQNKHRDASVPRTSISIEDYHVALRYVHRDQ